MERMDPCGLRERPDPAVILRPLPDSRLEAETPPSVRLFR